MKRIGKFLLTLLALAVILVGAGGGYLIIRQARAAAQAEQSWQNTQVTLMQNLGATKTLEILPLVEKAASAPSFQAEHGVSYLIKTDTTAILFDVGQNTNATDPSPLQANMAQLGITPADFQIIVISHNHPDHTGGVNWWRNHTFSLGNQQINLADKRVYLPEPITYPGLTPIVARGPQKIAEGVATIGTIDFAEIWPASLLRASGSEQALAINVEDVGIVVITGCGHQTLPKLLSRTSALFDERIAGLIGGLHYGNADAAQLEPYLALLRPFPLRVLALSPHDTEASARQVFRAAFPDLYQDVEVGRPIRVGA